MHSYFADEEMVTRPCRQADLFPGVETSSPDQQGTHFWRSMVFQNLRVRFHSGWVRQKSVWEGCTTFPRVMTSILSPCPKPEQHLISPIPDFKIGKLIFVVNKQVRRFCPFRHRGICRPLRCRQSVRTRLPPKKKQNDVRLQNSRQRGHGWPRSLLK